MTVPSTIIAGGNGDYKEAVPAAAFSPGHLLEETSAGKFQKNSSSGGRCEALVAIENDLEGEGVSDAYATTDRARAFIPYPGAKCNMKIANGENIAIGDKLCSNGNGELREVKTDSSGTIIEDWPLAVSEEAVDMSGSSAADPDGWCRVRFL